MSKSSFVLFVSFVVLIFLWMVVSRLSGARWPSLGGGSSLDFKKTPTAGTRTRGMLGVTTKDTKSTKEIKEHRVCRDLSSSSH
jgi:hypothetical protein